MLALKKTIFGRVLHWIPYAFVRITASFIAGVLMGIFFGSTDLGNGAFWVGVAIVILYILVFFILKKNFFSTHHLIAMVGFVAVFLLGYLRVGQEDQRWHSEHIVHHINSTTYYVATLQDPGEERLKTIRYKAEVRGYKQAGQWQKALGKIYLYVDKSSQLKYGDQLLVKGAPQAVRPPQNPGEFDYKRFLTFKSIYHQHFLRQGDYQVIGNIQNPVWAMAYRLRAGAADILEESIGAGRELGIVQALVLGIKDDLDDTTQDAYAASGAMHVLAVSGLHVGIIYGIVFFLLGRFQSTKRGRWVVAVVCILVLWFYAMITGFSPSVLRAVTMFTFIIVGQVSGRDSNIYNTMAVSAFCLLMYDPYLIMSLGFQLSYLAVLGIVYVQPKVYQLHVFDHLIPDKLWALTSVALAAQLATVPLCLLYFHQFPTYFFLSNIIVIPGATLTLCLGLGVLAFGFIDTLATGLGWVLKWCVLGMNEVVFAIRELPFSQITEVSISGIEATMIFGIIVSFLIFFHYKNMSYAWSALAFAVVFSVSHTIRLLGISDKVTVYNISGHTAVDFIAQGESFLYTDPDFEITDGKVGYHIQPNHLLSEISSVHWVQQESTAWVKTINNVHMAHFKNNSFVILDQPVGKTMDLKNPLSVGYVLVCKRFDKDLAWIKNNFVFKRIILDGSLSWYQAKGFKREAEELALSYYSVYDEGAYEIELN
ncbi:ComEC/Rec2 family competence protein [Fulvivirga sp. 29W222]|uniref:ComEC/Rec2 family competence protein n=1 Tax=Fulvivirga marina TaxID=2494733 RepID=A0A937KCQ0_9BACT|nr:ComEC/Rec2 family competence protein [Fulvivirga marina]MBL6448366.1 ComEC/Rec2 family competence protein [Fulvivirga marina]